MKKYTFLLDRLEIRSPIEGAVQKRIIRGYASVPNKKDIYKYSKDTLKSFKSLFTDNCIKSMEKQAKSKKVFVDAEHQFASSVNIRSILDAIQEVAIDKGLNIKAETDRILDYLKVSEFPLAKVTNINIDDKGLFLETELNPAYREVDLLHRDYFDSVWGSLKSGFLNGISINFVPTSTTQKFMEGDWVTVIDDVDLYGFSYTGEPALPDNNIVEVAMRSAMEIRTAKEEEATASKEINTLKNQLDNEIKKREEVEKQMKEDKEMIEEQGKKRQDEMIMKELEALKSQVAKEQELRKKLEDQFSEQSGRKGIVSPMDKYSSNPVDFRKDFRDNLDQLNMGQLLHLQAEFETNRYLPEETQRLLGKGKDDIIVNRR